MVILIQPRLGLFSGSPQKQQFGVEANHVHAAVVWVPDLDMYGIATNNTSISGIPRGKLGDWVDEQSKQTAWSAESQSYQIPYSHVLTRWLMVFCPPGQRTLWCASPASRKAKAKRISSRTSGTKAGAAQVRAGQGTSGTKAGRAGHCTSTLWCLGSARTNASCLLFTIPGSMAQ